MVGGGGGGGGGALTAVECVHVPLAVQLQAMVAPRATWLARNVGGGVCEPVALTPPMQAA